MFTTTPFSAWDLKSELQEGLTNLGWEFSTQVQKETIPIADKTPINATTTSNSIKVKPEFFFINNLSNFTLLELHQLQSFQMSHKDPSNKF